MIHIQEVLRADFVRAHEAGQIAEMPEVIYYGTRMFAVSDCGTLSKKEIAEKVADFAHPGRTNRDRK